MCQKIQIFILITLLVSASKSLKAAEVETLEDIFASAIVRNFKSFMSLTSKLRPEQVENGSSLNSSCLEVAGNASALSKCLHRFQETNLDNSSSLSYQDICTFQEPCLSLWNVGTLYKISPDQNLTKKDVVNLSPAIVYSILSCRNHPVANPTTFENKTAITVPPSTKASWGYSFLFVTLINLCSLTGAIVLPCMKLKSYKLVLMFMVALAVGTLTGSGLLILIPEAFHLANNENSNYTWKATAVMGGIYLFYLTEKLMRMINTRREDTSLKKRRDELATKDTITTSFRRVPIDNALPGKDASQIAESMGGICTSPMRSHSSFNSNISDAATPISLKTDEEGDDADVTASTKNGDWDNSPCSGHGHSHKHYHLQSSTEVAPVAYMIIFGDALHNFIDGLSIGSAFTQSIMAGIGVSVAVMCEELPHELGDFAILLNAGMRFRKALMYNFLSACTCYIGTFIGIILAENTESHEWIFAIAGGMFLYISLVDMMPEMNTAAESKEGKQFGETKTFLLQNCGLATGYLVMLLFALYGGNIHFDD